MEIRRLQRTEIDQAVELADKTFNRAGKISMGNAFPQIFSSKEIHSFGAFDEGEIVSFIGLVPSIINIGTAKLKVFSIGSVCTDERYRGRGISTSILNKVYKYIESAGASLLFISGDRGMYMRNNCYHFGKTKQYTLNQRNMSDESYSGIVREGDSNDACGVNKLRKEAEVHFEASDQEWVTQLESGGYASVHNLKQQLFIAENEGELKAYVVIGLPDKELETKHAIVTEYGGEPIVVRSILMEILKEKLSSEIKITIPWHEKYNGVFTEYLTQELNHGGSIYLVNPENLLGQSKRYLSDINSLLAEKLKIEKTENGEYQIICGNYFISVTKEELIKFLFSPDGGVKFEKVKNLFPIPLPNPEGLYYV